MRVGATESSATGWPFPVPVSRDSRLPSTARLSSTGLPSPTARLSAQKSRSCVLSNNSSSFLPSARLDRDSSTGLGTAGGQDHAGWFRESPRGLGHTGLARPRWLAGNSGNTCFSHKPKFVVVVVVVVACRCLSLSRRGSSSSCRLLLRCPCCKNSSCH